MGGEVVWVLKRENRIEGNGAGIVVEIGGFTVSEEGGTFLWSFQIQGARLIAHTRDRGVRNEITLPKAMITIQSNNRNMMWKSNRIMIGD